MPLALFFNHPGGRAVQAGMRYITLLFVLLQAVSGRAQTPSTEIHGTWTAELHQGKVFLQVRTTPPADWNRSGNWNGDWNMGQSFPVDELSGLPANDERLTASTVKFDLRRVARLVAMKAGFRVLPSGWLVARPTRHCTR